MKSIFSLFFQWPILILILIFILMNEKLTFIQATSVNSIPADYKRCHRSLGVDFNKCLDVAVEDALHKLARGVPQLGIAPLDPLEVNTISITQGNGPVSINLRFDNIKMYGISKSKLSNHRVDLNKNKYYVKALTPQFRLEADYVLSGNILLLPISGKGKTNITLDDLPSVITQDLEPFYRDGILFMREKKFSFKMFPKKMRMYFGNLFNGDKLLGEGMNKFLNDNWQILIKELNPSLEGALSKIFSNVANQFFIKVPFDEIFPK